MAVKHKKKKSKAARRRKWLKNLKKAWAARRRQGRKTRRHKSRKCPKTQKRSSLRSALLCLLRRKRGRARKADAKVYKKAMRVLRRSKKGRAMLKKHGLLRRRRRGKK